MTKTVIKVWFLSLMEARRVKRLLEPSITGAGCDTEVSSLSILWEFRGGAQQVRGNALGESEKVISGFSTER